MSKMSQRHYELQEASGFQDDPIEEFDYDPASFSIPAEPVKPIKQDKDKDTLPF